MEQNVRYCIECGAQNPAEGETCCACGRPLQQKDDTLIRFLRRKTKEKLVDEASGRLFDAVKNFLLSHLYGVVVAVSLAVVAVTGIVGGGSGTGEPAPMPEGVIPVESRPVSEESSNLEEYLQDVVKSYVASVDTNSNVNPEEAALQHELRLPVALAPDARHELTADREMEYSLNANMWSYGKAEIDPAQPHTEVGTYLRQQGYPIAEAEVEENYDQHRNLNGLRWEKPVGSRTYLFTLVEVDGAWYIADDRLVTDTVDPIAAWEASSLITLYAHRTSPLVQVGSASYYQRYDLLLPDSDPFALRAERQLTDGREPEGTAECIVTLDYPTVNPAQPLRSLTGEMMGAGYTVAEGVRSEQYYDVGGVLLGSAEWLITMTFLDGSWYVVESVQLS